MSTSIQVQQPSWIFNSNAPAAVNGVPVAQPNFVNNAFGQFVLVTSNQQVQFVLNPYGAFTFTFSGNGAPGVQPGQLTGNLYIDLITGNIWQLQVVSSINTWVQIGNVGQPPVDIAIGGNTAGVSATISSGTAVFAGGNNITLSQNGQTISIIGPTGGGGGGNVISVPGGSTTGTVTFSAGPGITVSTSGNGVVGISGNTTAASGAAVNALSVPGGSSAGNISFSAGPGITISSSGNSIIAFSGNTTAPVTAVASIGPAGSLSSGAITVSGVNITVSNNGAGVLQLSAAVGGGGGGNIISVPGGSTTGTVTFSAGPGITVSTSGNGVVGISGNTTAASGPAVNSLAVPGGSSSGVLTLSAGPGITISSSGNSIIGISGNTTAAVTAVASIGAAGSLSSGPITISGVNITVSNNGAGVVQLSAGAAGGTLSLIGSNGISLSSTTAVNATSISILTTGFQAASVISLTQNMPFNEIDMAIATGAASSGATSTLNKFGSSLFLNRIYIPANMNLSEVDLAQNISFGATNSGAGQYSQSLVIYSFGNSTSLASVMSVSKSWSWSSGTVTNAASTLTNIQGGWSSQIIHPMTFASSSLSPGEYVVGNLINFSVSSSQWSVSLYGANLMLSSTTSFAAVTATLALKSVTAWSAVGTQAFTGISTIGQLSTSNAGNVGWLNSLGSSTASSITSASSLTDPAQTWIQLPIVTSISSTAMTAWNAAPTLVTISGVTALAALSSATFTGVGSTPTGFSYQGLSAAVFSTASPTQFSVGIMSTGAIPVAITLTSTAVTMSGSFAFQQPWFALIGS